MRPTDDEVHAALRVAPHEHARLARLTQDVVDPVTGARSKNPEWLAARLVGGYLQRFSGSTLGDVLGHGYNRRLTWTDEKNRDAGVARFIEGTRPNSNMQWGTDHEHVAQAEFVAFVKTKYAGSEVAFEEFGLIVDNVDPFLGYSPDGKLTVKHADGTAETFLVEIKCPGVHKRRSVVRGQTEPIYGTKDWLNGECGPAPVYYWLQMQMGCHVMKLERCYFVVWTPQCMQVSVIEYDKEFFEEVTLPLARDTYFNKYIQSIRTSLETGDGRYSIDESGNIVKTPPTWATTPAKPAKPAALIPTAPVLFEGLDLPVVAGAQTESSSRSPSVSPEPSPSAKRKHDDAFPVDDDLDDNDNTDSSPEPVAPLAPLCFNVRGINSYRDACKRVLTTSETPAVELVPEPTNNKDSNAIRVVVSGETIGYVPHHMTGEARAHLERDTAEVVYVNGKPFHSGWWATIILRS